MLKERQVTIRNCVHFIPYWVKRNENELYMLQRRFPNRRISKWRIGPAFGDLPTITNRLNPNYKEVEEAYY